jgi:hypothetical protein
LSGASRGEWKLVLGEDSARGGRYGDKFLVRQVLCAAGIMP